MEAIVCVAQSRQANRAFHDWFENVRTEVMAAHEKAAIFDCSSFGKIEVRGPEAEAFLLHTCSGFLSRAPGSVINLQFSMNAVLLRATSLLSELHMTIIGCLLAPPPSNVILRGFKNIPRDFQLA